MDKKRIEDLSNLVFGLALTLGAITLTKPATDDIGSLLNILIQFGLSFTIIIWIWWIYNNLVTEQDLDRRGMVTLNIVLLFLVVIEPFLLTVSATYTSGRMAYAVDLGFTLVILAVFTDSAKYDMHIAPTDKHKRLMQSNRNLTLLCAALFFVSLVPQLIMGDNGYPIQSAMWLTTLLVGVVGRQLRARRMV